MPNSIMFVRYARRCRLPSRTFADNARLRKADTAPNDRFLSPEEFTEKSKMVEAEKQEFKDRILGEAYEFQAKIITENKVRDSSKRPVPLNVELLQYKPLKVEKTHGHKVAEVSFRGYEEKELIRASEFAARAAFFLGIPCSDIKKNKTERRLYTVIRSPFAQAKSKENFFRVTYNRSLEAFDAQPEVVDLWLSYINKHAIEKVEYGAKIHTRESLQFAQEMSDLKAGDMQLPEAYNVDAEDPIMKKVQEMLGSDDFKQYLEDPK